MMIRTILTLLVWIGQAFLFTCKAQAEQEAIPDFKGNFDVWLKNRAIYNQYNDSVFLIQNYKDWAAFFNRRSVKVHQLFEEDSQIMNHYMAYFKNIGQHFSTEGYLALRDELYEKMKAGQMADPFLLLATSDILEKEGAQVPDSLKSTNLINAVRLFGYIQVWNLGGDVEYMKKAYQCGMELLSEEAKNYPFYLFSYATAMRYITRTWWLVLKLQTIPEYRDNIRSLKMFLVRPDIDKIVSARIKKELQNILDTSDESLVRNTYLVNKSTMTKQEADSLMQGVIQRNLSKSQISSMSYVRTLYMQMAMGQITAKEAREKSLEFYDRKWADLKKTHMDATQLNDFLQPFYTFFYLNYKAEIPTDVKRATVQRMCTDIEIAFQNRKNQRKTTYYVRDLLRLSTYDKATMYLTPEEVEHYLSTLNMATQPASYAHSLNVTRLTDILMEGILKYQPDLLVGVLDNATVQDVKKNKKKLMDFAHEAAKYHDIGKNSIASLMNKGHRPLLPLERKLMDQHPEFAVQYLSLTPKLAMYKDIALGHEKWYNGKGGYPDSFDNTKSPLRILIDVVALADHFQFAAEQCVRKDGHENPLVTNMDKLRQGAGTIYNPDLVALVDAHKDIKEKIAYQMDEGWVKTSYEVARTYFEKPKL